MNRIGIRFSDNDFGNTIRGFLEVIHNGLCHRCGLENGLTKERIVELFNSMSISLYRIYQNPWAYDDHAVDLASYLRITPSNIYFDDEVDLFLKGSSHANNGEFHWYDHDLFRRLNAVRDTIEDFPSNSYFINTN